LLVLLELGIEEKLIGHFENNGNMVNKSIEDIL